MSQDPYFFHLLKPRNSLVFCGAVAFSTGVVLREALLLGLAAACFTALAIALWQTRNLLRAVNVRREHHARAFQNNSVAVSLTVEGTDDTGAEMVLVEDDFPPATASRIRRLVEHPLMRGRPVRIQYFGQCEHRRGLYILGPARLAAHDALGFFRREVVFDEFTNLLVYPQAVDLQFMDLLGEGTLPHVGLETKPRTGYSEEFVGIREYRTGDPQSIIHWKSSARHGRLMVKEFQEEMTTEVYFFLDLGRMGLVGVGDHTSVEYGIKCCASMAKRAIERGHHTGLFVIGKSVDYTPAGCGTAHLLTVLDRLALLRPEGESGFTAVVADLARDVPRGATAVLIMGATTVEFDSVANAISRLMDRHVLPVVVLIDDRAFIKVFREQEKRHHEALPLEEIVARLQVLGARVHVVARARSMEQALLQGLEREAV